MSVLGVNVGDYVATRGEPAYADYYNCRIKEFVVVPELSPKYIIEPVACGVNCVMQAQGEIKSRMPGRALIIGSGFLAWVAYNVLKNEFNKAKIDVVGRSNKDLFGDILKDKPEGTYDVVIDLGSGTEIFDTPILNNEALVIFGVEKEVTTNFQQLLWKACTMIFPSPRNMYFHNYMLQARNMVASGALNVDKFWSKGYNRDTEWQQAFADGLTRPQNYSRGYIYWNQNGN
jgi:threonine dehydrogenase-like Zn-dependent dehydrogenase